MTLTAFNHDAEIIGSAYLDAGSKAEAFQEAKALYDELVDEGEEPHHIQAEENERRVYRWRAADLQEDDDE
ncbi:MAG: hypothetical protein AB7T74_03070 [Clostridia bacterium]